MNVNKKRKGNFYVLGDSLSDTGALVSGVTALLKHLKMAKTVNMLPPFYKNSFSNGPVAAQIIADYLHVDLHPAWKFDLFLLADEQVGNNYAVSGAAASRKQALTIENFIINHFDICHQANALISQHQISDKDIILVEFGANDILYALKHLIVDDQDTIINTAVALIKNTLHKLISNGAQHILLCNAPNLSLIPLFKDSEKTKQSVLELTNKFNKMLANIVLLFNKKQKIIIEYDLFTAITNAITTFKNLDINNNIIAAAVTTDFSEMVTNGLITPHFNQGIDENNINNYFFFDNIHPNKWAHDVIAQQLIELIVANKIL